MFAGLPNGFLTTSPILGVALVGSILYWREIPNWAKSAAIAGALYLLVHAALNRASGGSAVFYRYPLEAIVLAAPLLAIGAEHLAERSRVLKLTVLVALLVSIGLQFVHVFLISCTITDPIVRTCLLA